MAMVRSGQQAVLLVVDVQVGVMAQAWQAAQVIGQVALAVQRARAQGVKIGRPSKLNDAVRTSVKLLRDGGMGIKEISKRLEIGVGSVYGALRAA